MEGQPRGEKGIMDAKQTVNFSSHQGSEWITQVTITLVVQISVVTGCDGPAFNSRKEFAVWGKSFGGT